MEQEPVEMFGKYKLKEKLGFGLTSEVWGSINEESDSKIAIKILKAKEAGVDEKEMFDNEVKVLANLKGNTNIIEVLDSGEHVKEGELKGTQFIVFE